MHESLESVRQNLDRHPVHPRLPTVSDRASSSVVNMEMITSN